jgi:KUP system potassium uptake protein
MPQVNAFLMIACVGLVLGFESSSRLAGAYGIAVSLTMLITSVLFLHAAQRLWGWSTLRASVVAGCFILLELTFVGANGVKLLQGGWFPLVVGFGMFAMMTTWKKGREILRSKLSETYLPFDQFLRSLKSDSVHRVPGTAVFLSGNPNGTPVALLHNLKHNKVLHERIIILTILTEEVPYVAEAQRMQVQQLREDIFRVTGHYGFMEQPDVPALLNSCASAGLKIKEMETSYFLSRETIIPHRKPGMAFWRRRLFSAMSRNAQSATTFFKLPPNRVVELGIQVEL